MFTWTYDAHHPRNSLSRNRMISSHHNHLYIHEHIVKYIATDFKS